MLSYVDMILPPPVIIAPIWGYRLNNTTQILRDETTPPERPLSLQYVPSCLRKTTMEWVHSGIQRKLQFLWNTFWWSSMFSDILKQYVDSGSVCAIRRPHYRCPVLDTAHVCLQRAIRTKNLRLKTPCHRLNPRYIGIMPMSPAQSIHQMLK